MRTTSTLSGPAVELAADHPGASDPEYRARRDAIAEVGAAYRPGDPIPDVVYAPEEDALWALVSGELAAKHERYAVREYVDAAARLDLPRRPRAAAPRGQRPSRLADRLSHAPGPRPGPHP